MYNISNSHSKMKFQWIAAIVIIAVHFGFLLPHALHLLKVGSGFTALSVCAGRFVSERSVSSIVSNELAGIASTLIDFTIDETVMLVYAHPKLLSFRTAQTLGLPVSRAQYMDAYTGCRLIISDPLTSANVRKDLPHSSSSSSVAEEYLLPSRVDTAIQSFVDYEFTAAAMLRNQTRAIVVVQNGNLVAEGYQQLLGMHSGSFLLGWSMTKSLHALIIGAAIQQKILKLSSPVKLVGIDAPYRRYLVRRNNHRPLTIADLLQMSDVLRFDEDYGIAGSCPAMLFTSSDMGLFATTVEKRQHGSGSVASVENKTSSSNGFDWYYSSGVSNVLASELRSYFKSDDEYWQFPQKYLFDPLGVQFTIQTDPSGTFVASSFGYGSARSWAAIGQLLLQRGMWRGTQIVPESFITFIQQPHPRSAGHYGASFWLNPDRVADHIYDEMDDAHPVKTRQRWMRGNVPADSFFMSGFDGQYTMIVPSLQLVVVRLGFTSDADSFAWDRPRFFGYIANHYTKERKGLLGDI
jgi:CubicO group peptidase (beta-lactamase class C family)